MDEEEKEEEEKEEEKEEEVRRMKKENMYCVGGRESENREKGRRMKGLKLNEEEELDEGFERRGKRGRRKKWMRSK